ncbi:MAG: hypothetical protein ACFB0C_08965 [Leptolyngbyaceae cyanobacterium]
MVGKPIRSFLEALPGRFSQGQTPDPTDDITELPPALRHQLSEKIKQLPIPQDYLAAVHEALKEALNAWQISPDTSNNSLVVLSSPVEAIAPILKASFQDDLPDYEVRQFLGGYQRPPDPLTILDHLRRELEPEQTADKKAEAEKDKRPTVMVIPSLEPCYLRCIQGWEGIEYLQALASQDVSRFWVFGCNHWAWAFLEKVCQVNAYLEQVICLPELTAEVLQTWLDPVLAEPLPDSPNLKFPEDQGNWESLANLAGETSTLAAQLWLQSLRLQSSDLNEDGAITAEATVELQFAKPAFPSLMSLEALDRYILHALLIHREMTRSHLALSLGEAERRIRSRVQVLQREGIIIQWGRRLTVHPAHYHRLCSELANNNFLIGKT